MTVGLKLDCQLKLYFISNSADLNPVRKMNNAAKANAFSGSCIRCPVRTLKIETFRGLNHDLYIKTQSGGRMPHHICEFRNFIAAAK
jgi:hypothetical protein